MRAIIIILFILAGTLCASDTEAVPAAPQADEIVLVVGNFPISGRMILPANETTFRLKESETGSVVQFHWKDLETTERYRVQKLYGLEVRNDRPVWGTKVSAVRYVLASGKTIIGLPMPLRDIPGQKALRTAKAPLMLLGDADIQAQEPIEGYESDFYSPREIYDRMVMEKPPGHTDAMPHLELAKTCANMGLYREALDHLKCAEIIDPRTEERNKEFRMYVINEDANKQALEAYQKLLNARISKEFLYAADLLDKLDRNFPNSDYKSRWDAVRAEVEAGAKAELNRSAIPLCYQLTQDLIVKAVYQNMKIDAKGNLVPVVPGKQVTTTHGDIFRGTLGTPDPSGDLSLKVGQMELTIAWKDIKAVTDIDLSEGASEVHPSFDQLKEYVCDTGVHHGLKMELMEVVSKKLKIAEARVKDIFDNRSHRKAHYENGILTRTESCVALQDAYYGSGSWLRDGAKPLPLVPDGGQPSKEVANNPEFSDDPNIWWASQNMNTQAMILRAIAAEKIFRVKHVAEESCDHCAGTGIVTLTEKRGPTNYRCPKCRGLKILYHITYE